MKKILQGLFQQEYLSRTRAKQILIEIAQEKFNAAHVASFLTVFQMRPISTEELQGFRDALLELCLKIDLSDYDSVDLCGTGGDGKDTFNISTLAAVVVAGAGYNVTKHGNYGVSSVCGSSNVLEKLGYKFTDKEDNLKRELDQYKLCFLHAPLFHPAMKAVGAIRRDLGVRTFFNLLGPLVNPVQPKQQMVGVSNLEIVRLYQYVLQQTDKEFAIVHTLDGYDEVSLTGNFKVITPKSEVLLTAQEIGQNKQNAKDLSGGSTIEAAAKIFSNILEGKGSTAQNQVVCTNAGIAIQRFNPQKALEDCIREAEEALLSQKAFQNFKGLLEKQ
ncbi:MAG: anthranilate phosphoribosyltransferase [Aureispira sp.]|jgi:anthranilate phosphoribosyltransferase